MLCSTTVQGVYVSAVCIAAIYGHPM